MSVNFWALTQYAKGPDGTLYAAAHSYGNSGISPCFPDGLTEAEPDANGQIAIWGLVLVCDLNHEAAAQDPRVHPYHSLFDVITPETVTAYAARGAKKGMMLGQLLAVLAQGGDTAFRHAMHA
jgi:hypothetical protein